jgi:hypothetical protein
MRRLPGPTRTKKSSSLPLLKKMAMGLALNEWDVFLFNRNQSKIDKIYELEPDILPNPVVDV